MSSCEVVTDPGASLRVMKSKEKEKLSRSETSMSGVDAAILAKQCSGSTNNGFITKLDCDGNIQQVRDFFKIIFKKFFKSFLIFFLICSKILLLSNLQSCDVGTLNCQREKQYLTVTSYGIRN